MVLGHWWIACHFRIVSQAKAFDGDPGPFYLGDLGDSCGYNFVTYGPGKPQKRDGVLKLTYEDTYSL